MWTRWIPSELEKLLERLTRSEFTFRFAQWDGVRHVRYLHVTARSLSHSLLIFFDAFIHFVWVCGLLWCLFVFIHTFNSGEQVGCSNVTDIFNFTYNCFLTGMGDSGYVFFNETATLIDKRFKELGAKALMPVGMGTWENNGPKKKKRKHNCDTIFPNRLE